jgi:hypothetical protein
LDITWGIYTRNRRSKRLKENLYEFLRCSTENSFRTATSPNLYLTQIRGFSLHKNEINKIRSSHYSSNDFQDSNKRKSTENKTLGYLPRVLFFNAFELGAANLRRCSHKKYELKQKRASRRKYKTHLSLTHFLCIGVL